MIDPSMRQLKRNKSSPEPMPRREPVAKPEVLTNGNHGPSHAAQQQNFGISSPESFDSDDDDDEYDNTDNLDRSGRRRRKPKRYSGNEFVEEVSDYEAEFDSDDDIVGEVVYDEEYLKKRKQRRKHSSSSEGDEEYQWDDDNVEEE
ncbi:chromatin modification-related protein EAF7-like, partial [Trifolium medium]|nr:chromatin modification-related protein EAF7-like [Trifolium medium]